jgi:hypothetical protein
VLNRQGIEWRRSWRNCQGGKFSAKKLPADAILERENASAANAALTWHALPLCPDSAKGCAHGRLRYWPNWGRAQNYPAWVNLP